MSEQRELPYDDAEFDDDKAIAAFPPGYFDRWLGLVNDECTSRPTCSGNHPNADFPGLT